MSQNIYPDNIPSPREIAQRIRDKVADLNEALELAYSLEIDVEIMVGRKTFLNRNSPVHIDVWCSQELR